MLKRDMNDLDLELKSYWYDLPPELIAQRPVDSTHRDESRLLIYKQSTGEVFHDRFYNIGHYLPPNALLVFNQSKVFPSRLLGQKKSGGKAELFLLGLTPNEKNLFQCLIKTRSKKRVGDEFIFAEELNAKIGEIYQDGTFGVFLEKHDLLSFLENKALIPIPPYIRKGESDELDKENYQTVFSKNIGSVAAPTAGLHFTDELLKKLKNGGGDQAFITLHVGLGTFKPVTTASLKDHIMHKEDYFIDSENLSKIEKHKNIFAVGTTSLRVLESIYGKEISPNTSYSTQIFLHPGVEIKSISGLITNFHLPESTLLMLVSALIGRNKALELYQMAISEKYRFFSYGDAMLIIR